MHSPDQADEFVVLAFREGIPYDEQAATMLALDPYIARQKGFVAREYFYSEESGRWVDHVVWASLEDARASLSIMDDPGAKPLFERFDPDSVVFGHYRRV